MTLMNIILSEMLVKIYYKDSSSSVLNTWFCFLSLLKNQSIRSRSSTTENNMTDLSLDRDLMFFFFQYNVKLNSCSKVSRVAKTYLRNCPGKCVIDLSVNSI